MEDFKGTIKIIKNHQTIIQEGNDFCIKEVTNGYHDFLMILTYNLKKYFSLNEGEFIDIIKGGFANDVIFPHTIKITDGYHDDEDVNESFKNEKNEKKDFNHYIEMIQKKSEREQ